MPDDSRKIIIGSELVNVLDYIKVLNGFHNDVKKIHTEVVPVDELQPVCIVIDELAGNEHYKSSEPGKYSTNLLEKVWKVFLHCFIYDNKNLQLACKRMQQDVEFALFKDRASRCLNGSCSEIMIINIDAFGTTVDKPNGGITVELDIHYRQSLTNPTLKG